ncbi:MAG: PilZ domain-containing protein [Solirubrobacterales bacterium]
MELRKTERQKASREGVMVLQSLEIPVSLVDVSTGGCKVRLPDKILDVFAQLLPCDIKLKFGDNDLAATAVWRSNALIGCQFPRHLSLDEVGVLMAARYGAAR